jgi:hypothetical protein
MLKTVLKRFEDPDEVRIPAIGKLELIHRVVTKIPANPVLSDLPHNWSARRSIPGTAKE